MRRRKSVLITAGAVMVASAGWASWYLLGLFEPYNGWSARRDIAHGVVQEVVVGYPGPDMRYYMEMADQFGFNVVLYGCEVTEPALNGIASYNDRVEAHLEEVHGKEWRTLFNEGLDSLLLTKDLTHPEGKSSATEQGDGQN